jgi:hypothetical protein
MSLLAPLNSQDLFNLGEFDNRCLQDIIILCSSLTTGDAHLLENQNGSCPSKAYNFSLLVLCASPKPLGLESGEIPNGAITASSTYSSQYHPNDARLKKAGSSCSWGPKVLIGSWLQVDLGRQSIVTGIATQGTCFSPPEWVKSYSISYSTDGTNWSYYKESGNIKVKQVGYLKR